MYLAYKLQNAYARRQERRSLILPLLESLLRTLPDLEKLVEQGYLYASHLTIYKKLLSQAVPTSSYVLIPEKLKSLINRTTSSLDQLALVFEN